ncbi:hypothetical protein FH972_021686 [Carpinus fangiana]|uniref:mannan endo-1,6-alpha-mannosidase n=1 Tax=Carpinus fangiana TaxID=176857 RepID=A0A5N6KS58_9ROSI|nr:hypothetical protein FH972_021686 [Carpinus fangiana]
MRAASVASTAWAAMASGVWGIELMLNDGGASARNGAFVTSHGMMSYYSGNESGQTPGYLPNEGQLDGYYWWEGGGMFGTLIDYWYYTGDETYNDNTMQALQWQVGEDRNYEPTNASQSLGNDDIAFWAFGALRAAELAFPDPPKDSPQWIPLVQTVLLDYIARWDTSSCNGGIHWQVFRLSPGWNYKNAISNGCMFNMAARLGKYTGNQTYIDWANKVWDWSEGVGIIDKQGQVWDGVHTDDNCTTVTLQPWTYNFGAYLLGAAAMWNITGDPDGKWRSRINTLISGSDHLFPNKGPMMEIGCLNTNTCNNDEKSFRAFTLSWMADTAKIAPFTEPAITPLLQTTAKGAAQQCSGGSDGVTCGLNWNVSTWDGTTGVGQQLSAMSAFLTLLAPFKAGPILNFKNGGTSVEDPTATGGDGSSDSPLLPLKPITTADKAGAAIITLLLAGCVLGGSVWMVWGK